MTENDIDIGQTDPLRSPCPLAAALDIVGDRWTLLVVRDLIAGKSRYGDFLTSPERITTSVLADRLRRLEQRGLVRAVLYQQHPPRREYQLTDVGRELLPAVRALARWGADNVVGTVSPEDAFARLTRENG